jgi:hypothetical protein
MSRALKNSVFASKFKNLRFNKLPDIEIICKYDLQKLLGLAPSRTLSKLENGFFTPPTKK